eukprot:TRINITY_DN15114_c0_g1_i2.p1 TRINITY_DN15114_c0_g1~~TRINITY_DN15114_c0_g1_i2.p1  ORF type:complete len:392 (+),score=98.75 TRINITY_DN15114_c0_g1_i2:86-1261(+)
MPRPSHMQRLRAQLAASQGEVRALREQVENLEGSKTPSKELAEGPQLGRLAAVRARWLDAERRAGAAELQLLQYAEGEQRAAVAGDERRECCALSSMAFSEVEALARAGLFKNEGDEWAEFVKHPFVGEIAARSELAAAQEAAWAALTAERAADRTAVRALRKRHRKKGQRQRRKGTLQRDESCATHVGEFATAHSGTAATSSDSMSSATSSAASSKALFIDNICFWVAAFVPKSWAPVCSEAARTVHKVMNIYVMGWRRVGALVACFQSKGAQCPRDREEIGPEAGWIHYYNLQLQALKHDIIQHAQGNPRAGCPMWITRWLLHMDFRMNMYENLRLHHKGLYNAACEKLHIYLSVIDKLGTALKAYDQRKLPDVEAGDSGAADADLAAA